MGWLLAYLVFHMAVALLSFWYFHNMFTRHTYWGSDGPPTAQQRKMYYLTFAVGSFLWPFILGWLIITSTAESI